ncbi:unnamed protein product [Diamesa tonsa]
MKSCFLLFSIAFFVCSVTAIHNFERTKRSKHNYGEAASILSFDSDGMNTDDELRESILLHPEVKDRKIVVVSIIGAFRKGKSFLMDYCLRFMYANYKSINFMDNPLNNPDEWMGDRDEPLTGFSWRKGSQRETTGIQLWSDVFLHEDEFGVKVAIVIVDTQGLFDILTPAIDNSRIFALGTLFSSVQIFNLNDVIQEDQLQYLQLATDFARFAISHNNDKTSKPFQKLLFLMRDWTNDEEYSYGFDGGRKYIKEQLQTFSSHKEEHRSVRQFIHSSFDEILCFLMPRPDGFINKKGYDGRWSEMDDTFKSQLFDFVSSLLSPSKLDVKKINNKELTTKQLNDYMKSYFEIFKSKELLRIETIYEATARTQLTGLVTDCIELYKSIVDMQILNYSTPYFDKNLENNHQLFKNYTLLFYKSSNKMGNDEQKIKFMEQLNDSMEKEYKVWQKRELLNHKNYNDEMNRIQNAIDQREIDCRKTDDLYQQKLKELGDAQNVNANLNKDLDYANKEFELKIQSLSACDDKLVAADKYFELRDQACNKTEKDLELSSAKLEDSQDKFLQLNGNYNTALAEIKTTQQSLHSCLESYTEMEISYKLRDQSCNAIEIDKNQTSSLLENCNIETEKLQNDLNGAEIKIQDTEQYCEITEKWAKESVSNLEKNKSFLKVVKQQLFERQLLK